MRRLVLLNIVAPGVGLALAGEHRLGWSTTGVYLLSLAYAIGGSIWPGAVPATIRLAAAILAVGLFLFAQVLLVRRIRLKREPAWRMHVAALRETAEAHLQHERFLDALIVVDQWSHEDPADPEPWILRGEVYLDMGRADRAQRSLRRASSLDREGLHTIRIREARDRLSIAR